MPIPTPQPQISAQLMLIRESYPRGKNFIDLYGTFCRYSREFEVEAVALAGTRDDITDLIPQADINRINRDVNADGAGHEEAESRRAEALDMQSDEHAFFLGAA